MSQSKKIRKKYDPSRNRNRIEPFILNNSYFYHGSVFENTVPRHGTTKSGFILTPEMVSTILKQKRKWSGILLRFYNVEDSEPRFEPHSVISDGYISERELRDLIKQRHAEISANDSDIEKLVSTGYFVVPNHEVNLSESIDEIVHLFVHEGAYDYTVSRMAAMVRQDKVDQFNKP